MRKRRTAMKKVTMFICIICLVMLATGCTKTCKIEGCKEEVYKEGLCSKHYYVNQGADMVGDVINGIKDIVK